METEVVGDPRGPTAYDWHLNWGTERLEAECKVLGGGGRPVWFPGPPLLLTAGLPGPIMGSRMHSTSAKTC